MSTESPDAEDIIEELEDWLAAYNRRLTADALDEVMLQGEAIGLHLFADPTADSPTAGFQMQLAVAFLRATDELWVDEQIVKDFHDEVTPETVAKTVESQLSDFLGHGGLERRIVDNLREQLQERAAQDRQPQTVDESQSSVPEWQPTEEDDA